jgi:pimeloyl-ACP methyl ester carboxylesterase
LFAADSVAIMSDADDRPGAEFDALPEDGDEFASLAEAASEIALGPECVPQAERLSADIGDGQQVSVVRWGRGEPEVVFLHGGGQNARTWDLVLLGLGRPALAIDLPGHGQSSWREDKDYGPGRNAEAVAAVLGELAPDARGVVGMSLGGLTLIRLAAAHPGLVRRAVLVDVTPGSGEASQRLTAEQRGTVALTSGPHTYPSREEMIEAAVRASPRRPASAVRRGVIHNSRQLPDGTFAWRYDLPGPGLLTEIPTLWDDLGSLTMPVLLVKGAESAFTTESDLAEVKRRLPAARVDVVPDSGHAVQSDQPAALTALLSAFLWNARPGTAAPLEEAVRG